MYILLQDMVSRILNLEILNTLIKKIKNSEFEIREQLVCLDTWVTAIAFLSILVFSRKQN